MLAAKVKPSSVPSMKCCESFLQVAILATATTFHVAVFGRIYTLTQPPALSPKDGKNLGQNLV